MGDKFIHEKFIKKQIAINIRGGKSRITSVIKALMLDSVLEKTQ